MTRVGLFAGRFQPFHNGHLQIIHKMFEECDEVIIIIGSSDVSHIPDNPFTAGERYQMIRESMYNVYGRDPEYHIIPIADINRYDLWVRHVESLSPPFSEVWGWSPFTRRLFEEAGYTVKGHLVERDDVKSGTEIRQMMIDNHPEWTRYIPEGTLEIIEKFHLIERLRAITEVEARYK